MKELKFGTYWQSKKSEGEFWTFDSEECTRKDEDHDWAFDDEECLYVEGSTNHEDNDYVKEPIEWLVLEEDDEKALLLSKYALDAKAYNEIASSDGITWEDCTLREWINTFFLDKAFSEEEKARIIKSTDSIFLLSAEELDKYLSSTDCKCTEFCYDQGISIDSRLDNCSWWVRFSCDSECESHAIYISSQFGLVDYGGVAEKYGVRPALWIKK